MKCKGPQPRWKGRQPFEEKEVAPLRYADEEDACDENENEIEFPGLWQCGAQRVATMPPRQAGSCMNKNDVS